MNHLIEQLENINIFLSYLELDNENKKIIDDKIIEIQNITSSLETILKTLPISKEKYQKIKLTSQKDDFVIKNLFSNYWIINEYINNFVQY